MEEGWKMISLCGANDGKFRVTRVTLEQRGKSIRQQREEIKSKKEEEEVGENDEVRKRRIKDKS